MLSFPENFGKSMSFEMETVEVERFLTHGGIVGEEELNALIARFSDA